jgi:hypothetical protein
MLLATSRGVEPRYRVLEAPLVPDPKSFYFIRAERVLRKLRFAFLLTTRRLL